MPAKFSLYGQRSGLHFLRHDKFQNSLRIVVLLRYGKITAYFIMQVIMKMEAACLIQGNG